MFESDLFSGSWLGRTAHFNRIPILSRSITVTARKLKFGRLKLKTKKLNNMTTECHCQKTEIWLALHLWRFIFFKLFSPSSRMKEKLILAPLSGTTSLSEWTVSVIRQEAKNHLNFKSQVETFSTNSPLSYQFMLKLSLEKKQASTLTNNVSSHSSRWNFLRRRPLASRRLSRCARASRSPSAQRWVKFSTRCNKCNKCNKCNIKCTTVNQIFNSTTRCNWTRQEFII